MFQHIKTLEDLLEHDRKFRNKELNDEDVYTLNEICKVEIKDFTKFIPTISFEEVNNNLEIKLLEQDTYNEYFCNYIDNLLEIENVALIGGSAMDQFIHDTKNNAYYDDYDFAIYGIEDKEQFWKKVTQLIEAIKSQEGDNYKISHISGLPGIINIFYKENGVRKIQKFQIILRMYSSISDILHSIDLESSAVVYDGKTTYFSGISAISYLLGGFNIVDLSKRSLCYEDRLAKYLKRGFRIILPHLNLKNVIDCSSLDMPFLHFKDVSKQENLSAWKICFKFVREGEEKVKNSYTSIEYHSLNNERSKNYNSERIAKNESPILIYERDVSKFISIINSEQEQKDFFSRQYLDFLQFEKELHITQRGISIEKLKTIFNLGKDKIIFIVNECLQDPPCYDFIDLKIQEMISKIKPFSIDEWIYGFSKEDIFSLRVISEEEWYGQHYIEKIDYLSILNIIYEEEKCSICLHDDSKINLTRLKCGHYFHFYNSDCGGLLFICRDNSTIRCPICRAKIVSDN